MVHAFNAENLKIKIMIHGFNAENLKIRINPFVGTP